MQLLEAPLQTAEFIVLDTETNGLSGDACEPTEVAAVLVGGGELHERFSSLLRTSAPLRRGIQRFTGITQAMVDGAPPLQDVLPRVAGLLEGRVMVAHNAPFDRRVLRQAFARVGLEWPNPPVLCTAALARALLPLQRQRGLAVLADALGIEVDRVHRALADAETCARVLCALFPRLCASARSVAEAVALVAPRRRRATTRRGAEILGAWNELGRRGALPELRELPRDPGVYLFRDETGRVLYVGKSVSIRSRARAHFAPSGGPAAWTAHAAVVDYRVTRSELAALVLENRLIKQLRPPGNRRLAGRDDRLVYIRCRLDIPFPILEVARSPAAGHGVTVGPLRGRELAAELVEQLDSLFGLRHCGRRLVLREHPSAYGQMGRCLSPCLGDLDPNLYRRRLDEALRLFVTGAVAGQEPGAPLLHHVEAQMRAAAERRLYERAEALRRRARRLRVVLGRLEGMLEATHARPRLVVARHPTGPELDGFWLVGGRLVDWGPLDEDLAALHARTLRALARGGRLGELGAHVPPDEVDEVRIVSSWMASHPQAPMLELQPAPSVAGLERLLARASARERQPGDPASAGEGQPGDPASAGEGQLDHLGRDPVGADLDG